MSKVNAPLFWYARLTLSPRPCGKPQAVYKKGDFQAIPPLFYAAGASPQGSRGSRGNP